MRPALLWALAFLLLGGGAGLAIWIINIVYTGLFHPTDIPLLSYVLDRVGSDSLLFEVLKSDETVTIKASEAVSQLAIGIAVLILVAALGSIAHALISGGGEAHRQGDRFPGSSNQDKRAALTEAGPSRGFRFRRHATTRSASR
jgi:hypothetical protein